MVYKHPQLLVSVVRTKTDILRETEIFSILVEYLGRGAAIVRFEFFKTKALCSSAHWNNGDVSSLSVKRGVRGGTKGSVNISCEEENEIV